MTDPVTGVHRRISNENPLSGRLAFSQDIVRLRSTWGVTSTFGNTGTTYRVSEQRKQSRDGYWVLYWDWKANARLSIRAEIQNLTSREQRRSRIRYSGPRSLARIDEVEYQAYRLEPYGYIRIRRAL